MPILQACWSPCWCHNNVKHGSIAVGVYTIVLCIVSIVYTAWVMNGGQSSDLYSPFFETDLHKNAVYACGPTIAFLCMFIIAAILLLRGVRHEVRGFLLPWMYMMGFVILFTVAFGIWFVARYYIDPRSVLAAAMSWVFASINIYCFLCVFSQYQILKEYQSANIMLLYP
jgi:hypothetical protein